MKKLGILYIATGPYIHFWPRFYNSMNKYFCNDLEHKYIVFTDDSQNEVFNGCENVQFVNIENMPWPLITLLRFHFFEKEKKRLEELDYVVFLNANIECCREVHTNELFGDTDLFFTSHPGYYKEKPRYLVLERNKKSTAYVPYRKNTKYVIGAFFGGTSDAFIRMSGELKDAIEKDLKRNYIARWHDESHLNKYFAYHQNNRVISPAYCYPFGFEIPMEKILKSVDKKSVFDVNKFKGYRSESMDRSIINKIIDKVSDKIAFIGQRIKCDLAYVFGA